jgi:hypothetical protein
MAKYIKKPVEIEAIIWDGYNKGEVIDFITNCSYYFAEGSTTNGSAINTINFVVINTLEGQMYTSPGDYIIRGVNGEYYPCKPDIFEKTYEKVEE